MKFTRTEADIQRAILAHCNRLPGVTLFRVNSGAVTATYKGKTRFVRFTSMPGISDLIGFQTIHLGRVLDVGTNYTNACIARWIAIEVKRPGQKATPQQAAFLDLVREAGGLAIIATSVEEVIDALR